MRLPDPLGMIARHVAIGFLVAAIFVGALLAADVARLGSLVRASPQGPLAVGVLVFMVGLTFASAQFAFAIMVLSRKDKS